MILTSSLRCKYDIGALAFNSVGTLREIDFMFSGIILPSSISDLETSIRKFLEFLGGLSAASSIPGAIVGLYNNEMISLGEDRDLLGVSLERTGFEILLSVYLKKGSLRVGYIYEGNSPLVEAIGYAKSIRGMKQDKKCNDDSIVLTSVSYCDEGAPRKIYIGVVADGVTSLGKGYVASTEAITEFVSSLVGSAYKQGHVSNDTVMSSFKKTSTRLKVRVSSTGERVATTFTGFIYPVENKLEILSLGDTRAYLCRKNKFVQLTQDDKIPGTSVLTRALGTDKDEPHVSMLEINDDVVIVLVSDGVYGVVSEKEILKAIKSNKSNPRNAVYSVLSLVTSRKGRDDASIGVFVKRR